MATDAEKAAAIQKLAEWIRDVRAFFREVVYIVDKQKNTRPLDISDTQEHVLKYILKLMELGFAPKVIVLKGRQAYITTLFVAFLFWKNFFATKPNRTVFIADINPRTDNMHLMYETMYDNLPEEIRKMRPLKSRVSFRYKDTGAFCDFLSAESRRVGQGGTVTDIAATEAPYYGDNSIGASLLNAQADTPDAFLGIEGTANGFDPFFSVRWNAAVARADELVRSHGAKDLDDLLFNIGFWDGSLLPVFVCWKHVKEYRLNPILEDVNEYTLTEVERDIVARHGLDLEQIAWRRRKIREEFGGNVELFMQEYPLTPKEAFRFSEGARNWFATEIIDEMLDRSYSKNESWVRYELDWAVGGAPRFDISGYCTNRERLKVVATPNKVGEFYIRVAPNPKHKFRYVVGADIAEGKARGDWTVIYVKDRVTGEYVAKCRTRRALEYVAEAIAMLAVLYYNAGAFPEANGTGRVVVTALVRIYAYVLRDVVDQEDKEVGYGHQTTPQTKPLILSSLRQQLHEHPEAMLDYQFWFETQTFTQSGDGRKIEAEGTSKYPGLKLYDDSILGAAITNRADQVAPPVIRESEHDFEYSGYGEEEYGDSFYPSEAPRL